MKLTMLGTGHATVTECYNTCFILQDGENKLLVDGGGGNTVLRQLKLAGVNWRDVHHIFVTHKHLDHICGIFWLIRVITDAMAKGTYDGKVCIYSHAEVIDILKSFSARLLKEKQIKHMETGIDFVTIDHGDVITTPVGKLTALDTRSTKAKQLGFLLEYQGRRLMCCGDEPLCPEHRDIARGADWLLHEAFCLESQADIYKPYEKNHSTAAAACRTAAELGIKNVLLYHSEDSDLANHSRLYAEEGKQYYSGGVFVPGDLESIEV